MDYDTVGLSEADRIMEACALSRLSHLRTCAVSHCALASLVSVNMCDGISLFVPSDRHYCTFRTMSDKPPLDGRKVFFDQLHEQLTETQLATLQRWDAGDYSRQSWS
jgi:hypothetical protein